MLAFALIVERAWSRARAHGITIAKEGIVEGFAAGALRPLLDEMIFQLSIRAVSRSEMPPPRQTSRSALAESVMAKRAELRRLINDEV